MKVFAIAELKLGRPDMSVVPFKFYSSFQGAVDDAKKLGFNITGRHGEIALISQEELKFITPRDCPWTVCEHDECFECNSNCFDNSKPCPYREKAKEFHTNARRVASNISERGMFVVEYEVCN